MSPVNRWAAQVSLELVTCPASSYRGQQGLWVYIRNMGLDTGRWLYRKVSLTSDTNSQVVLHQTSWKWDHFCSRRDHCSGFLSMHFCLWSESSAHPCLGFLPSRVLIKRNRGKGFDNPKTSASGISSVWLWEPLSLSISPSSCHVRAWDIDTKICD